MNATNRAVEVLNQWGAGDHRRSLDRVDTNALLLLITDALKEVRKEALEYALSSARAHNMACGDNDCHCGDKIETLLQRLVDQKKPK